MSSPVCALIPSGKWLLNTSVAKTGDILPPCTSVGLLATAPELCTAINQCIVVVIITSLLTTVHNSGGTYDWL